MINMLLSIITINRNNSSGLERTMSSVVSQTLQDFEYIVIDGASTDSSVDVIKHYAPLFGEKLRWISEPDSGIYNAMNKGIQLSVGKFLLFLNSGDCLVHDSILEDCGIPSFYSDIVIGKCNILKDEKVVWTYIPRDKYSFGTLFFQGIAHQSSFISRILFEKYGLYDETYKYNGDTEFWYRTIIDNKVSTQSLDYVITNYSLGGLSDILKDNAVFQDEHHRILSNPLYVKFLPDYQEWKKDKEWINKYRIIEKYPRVLRFIVFLEKQRKRVSTFWGK